MPSPLDLVTCWVHRTPVARAGSNQHHINPQAAGGSDDASNIVTICATCHAILHRAEEMLSKDKSASVAPLIATSYGDAGQRTRMHTLVKAAATAFQDAEESGFTTDDVAITISRDVFTRLQVLAQGARDPISNRRIGVGRYAETILRAHLRTKGISVPPLKG